MLNFVVFALYLCFGVVTLIVWPVMLHPTLPARRKLLINGLFFVIIVPIGLVLYAYLGVPKMAGS